MYICWQRGIGKVFVFRKRSVVAALNGEAAHWILSFKLVIINHDEGDIVFEVFPHRFSHTLRDSRD